MKGSSQLSGFYRLRPEERLKVVAELCELEAEQREALSRMGGLSLERANGMIENVIGGLTLPLGIATNFLINGRDYLVPMAIEEPSVVAGASNAAKMARAKGGFRASSTEPIMIGQVLLLGVKDFEVARQRLLRARGEILARANEGRSTLVRLGGGAKEVMVRAYPEEGMVVELWVDCKDAMGANAVNSMVEAVAPLLEELTGGRALLRILSNLATKRLARAEATFPKEAVGGERVVKDIVAAYRFAKLDPYRCATHNKGIMNGIVAVALATGQDTRALEAGAHAYAALHGPYRPLSSWEEDANGDLVGRIELPLAVGIVGGATAANPVAQASLRILGVRSSRELAEVMAAVGLAQNLAALRALVVEGIQKGHMRLHAKNLAASAGAKGEEIDRIAEQMIREGKVSFARAQELLKGIKDS